MLHSQVPPGAEQSLISAAGGRAESSAPGRRQTATGSQRITQANDMGRIFTAVSIAPA